MWNASEWSRQNVYITFILIIFLSGAPKNGGEVIEELISESGYGLTGFKNVFGPESAINDSYRVRRKNRK